MLYTKKCPQCNISFSHSDKRQKFCSKSCLTNSKKTGHHSNCKTCNKEIYITKKRKKTKYGNFCSYSCIGKYRKKRFITSCTNCGKDIERLLLEKNRTKNFFCSKACLTEAQKTHPDYLGVNHARFNINNHILVNCAFCNKEIKKRKCDIKNNKKTFCNRTCINEWQKINSRGPNNNAYNPNSKRNLGKRIRDLEQYQEHTKKIYQRDNYICQLCNNKNKKQSKLNCHHIYPFSKILENYQVNDLQEAIDCKFLWNKNNLITLCGSCHKNIRGKEHLYEYDLYQKIFQKQYK